ncbi:MAG: membrane protein insertase YidC [Pseudomonadota bacterium]
MLGGENKEETRNLILAAVLSMAVVFTWYALFPPPEPPVEQPVAEGQAPTQGQAGVAGGTGATGADVPVIALDRDSALERTGRVEIASDAVFGSISLIGGRIDDLHLEDYRETLEEGSDTVTLLNPTGGPAPYYAVYGWLPTAAGGPGDLPGPNTPWEVESGDKLTPDSDVTLRWDNGEGLIFRRTYALDDRYMFDVTQTVENTTAEQVQLAPYGYIARRGMPDIIGFFILHEGAVSVIDGELTELSYSDLEDLPPNRLEGGLAQAIGVTQNGWLGFTDKYWMTTLVPDNGQVFDAVYKAIPGPVFEYRTEMRMPVETVEPGATGQVHTRLFAGAKELRTIRDYEEDLNITNFEDAIDWGWFYFLTKPVATLLIWIQGYVGNMGASILILTLIVKLALFPLAHKSYVAMSRMKKLQPEMEKIKERVGDDKMKMQQEMMALYKKEKVNPAAGCLPILVQIPIFFSLYKVLFVTIEMRHAPFLFWITDLSAPDPTSWINLFGILPYDVSWAPALLSIGVLPIIMGITMWMQQKLNPAPTDPTQAAIFAWMPWVFMFMLGTFASGLVLYWIANNVLTFAQQYAIMRSQGVEVDFFGNVTRSFKRHKDKPKSEREKPSDGARTGAKADANEDELDLDDAMDAADGMAEATEVPETDDNAEPKTAETANARRKRGPAKRGKRRR